MIARKAFQNLHYLVAAGIICCTALLCFAKDDGVYNMPDVDTHDKVYNPTKPSIMQKVATPKQLRSFLASNTGDYFVFGEDRRNSIRRFDALPAHWLKKPGMYLNRFAGTAQPGEFYVFQLGAYAARKSLRNVKISFTDLANADSKISKSNFRVFNLSGNDYEGNRFDKRIDIAKGKLQPIWIGIEMPKSASGVYTGEIKLTADGEKTTSIKLSLNVAGKVLKDHGDSDSWRMSRLRWLDSKLGLNDDVVCTPYKPIAIKDNRLDILGRTIVLSSAGLPAKILSRFNPSNTSIYKDDKCFDILAKPMVFALETDKGIVKLAPQGVKFTYRKNAIARWSAVSTAEGFTLKISGSLEFDGFISLRCTLTTPENATIKNISLVTEYSKPSSRYFMGLGKKGGYTPARNFTWRWNNNVHQDGWWMGAVNGGMKVQLKGANYRQPLINAYYKYRKLNLPLAWHNKGKGGITLVHQANGCVKMSAFTGAMKVRKSKSLNLFCDLYITPFKTLQTNNQWAHRYFHPTQNVVDHNLRDMKRVKAKGANTVNIHHNKEQNPVINYPYFDGSFELLKKCVADAHKNGIKVKIYYTTREITNNMPEIFAFNSLNGEIICPGPGRNARPITNRNGPHPWLLKNIGSNFIPAWREIIRGRYKGLLDLAVITTPNSRLDNFYMEGLAYTVKHAKIDGLYIDDTALGRKGFQRIRRIFDELNPGAQIDMHSWSHFNKMAGQTNSAYCFMQNFPYYNKLWLGEGFAHHYHKTPADYWLVEVSGIPFGLMSEMMYRGMPIRGMLYGMTGRLGWRGNPQPMWKVMDLFGMKNSQYFGYWDPTNPVKPTSEKANVSTYKKDGKAMIVVASWDKKPVETKLNIDFKKLGVDPAKAVLIAPEIKGSQAAKTFKPGDTLTLTPGKGWILILSDK